MGPQSAKLPGRRHGLLEATLLTHLRSGAGLIFLAWNSDGERSGRLDGWAIHALSLQSQHPTSFALLWILLLHEGTEPFNQRYGIQSASSTNSL